MQGEFLVALIVDALIFIFGLANIIYPEKISKWYNWSVKEFGAEQDILIPPRLRTKHNSSDAIILGIMAIFFSIIILYFLLDTYIF